ncbi:type 2 periplasmic-binding domain-containing protein [Roseateles oligotrophus]|uniref:Transporter substrate-binding domain-containing protein n=1 Tax=Roseateles oligotrophus TaxID=1769250 RepID=A0ABT2YKW6_9BURK|nr:transporter substrate-binding domain-containing protein [Roseateles oligotrophus]MCV2370706.1 transporter substrate-binding domain-containing protein [Roseateles oligotrophus]
MKSRLLSLVGSILLTGVAWADEPTVMVEYRDKPPYSYTKEGRPSGFLIERTIEIFRLAKVNAIYEEIPLKRILRDIQSDLSPICSPSWYKLPERELYARFSLPIHEDKPHLVLVGMHAVNKVRTIKTLRALLADPELKLGKVSGVSYGADLDALISRAAQTPIDPTVTPVLLAKMIKRQRADYMLIDQEDYEFLNQKGELDAEEMTPFEFADMPAGLKRYLMCSKRVGPDTMARLDKAILQVVRELK